MEFYGSCNGCKKPSGKIHTDRFGFTLPEGWSVCRVFLKELISCYLYYCPECSKELQASVLFIENDGCNDCPLAYWRTDGSGDNRYRELPRKPRPLAAGMNWQNN